MYSAKHVLYIGSTALATLIIRGIVLICLRQQLCATTLSNLATEAVSYLFQSASSYFGYYNPRR